MKGVTFEGRREVIEIEPDLKVLGEPPVWRAFAPGKASIVLGFSVPAEAWARIIDVLESIQHYQDKAAEHFGGPVAIKSIDSPGPNRIEIEWRKA